MRLPTRLQLLKGRRRRAITRWGEIMAFVLIFNAMIPVVNEWRVFAGAHNPSSGFSPSVIASWAGCSLTSGGGGSCSGSVSGPASGGNPLASFLNTVFGPVISTMAVFGSALAAINIILQMVSAMVLPGAFLLQWNVDPLVIVAYQVGLWIIFSAEIAHWWSNRDTSI